MFTEVRRDRRLILRARVVLESVIGQAEKHLTQLCMEHHRDLYDE